MPIIELVVANTATFSVEVHEVGVGLIDSFRYADVDTGVYTFPIESALWRGEEKTAIVLRFEGAVADSVVYAESIGQ